MLTLSDYAIRIGLSMAAGFVVGIERERKNKPAGIKTHMLVSLGATIFVLSSLEFANDHAKLVNSDQSIVRLDLMRVIGGLIGGIGFLGAGAIMQRRGDVEGITTATTIWVTAALGMVCGVGQMKLAFVSILSVLIVLYVFGALERYLEKHVFKTRGQSKPEDT